MLAEHARRDPQPVRAEDHLGAARACIARACIARACPPGPGGLACAALQRRLDQVHRRRADEPGHEQVGGAPVELLGRGDLLQHAVPQHRHPAAQRHGLGLVVGHVDGGHPERALQLGDLGAHLHPELGVQVGQRLVHQERAGLADDGPAHGDPLPLPAGQLPGLAAQQLLQFQDAGGLLDPAADLLLRGFPVLQAEGHVVPHGQVRVQRVALEHHGDVPVPRLHVVDRLPVDEDGALGDLLQAGHHAQGRGLAAAGRADQHHELAVRDGQVQRPDRGGPVLVALGDALEHDPRH